MEISNLYQGLTFLSYATGIIVIIVGIMLVKLTFDVSKLVQNLNETTDIVRAELTPTLKNINKSVEIVSNIVIKTDEGINKAKDFIAKSPLKILTKLTSLTGTVAGGLLSGISTAFKIFCKRKSK